MYNEKPVSLLSIGDIIHHTGGRWPGGLHVHRGEVIELKKINGREIRVKVRRNESGRLYNRVFDMEVDNTCTITKRRGERL